MSTANTRSKTKTVVFAPHDDGRGAFAILSRLACTLASKAKAKGVALKFLFLYGFAQEADARKWVKEAGLKRDCLVYGKRLNLYVIPKDKVAGAVRLAAIPEVLKRIWIHADHWPEAERPVDWSEVSLCISMGVPWLHRIARRHGIPTIEIGDTCVSMILRGCLEEGGLLTPFAGRVLDKVADYEFMATEAWLLPFATPAAYVDHFASASVPVNWLPGLFGQPYEQMSRRAKALRAELRGNRQIKARPMVDIYGGQTGVWDSISTELRKRPGGKGFAFIEPGCATQVRLLEGGKVTTIRLKKQKVTSRALLYASMDLGVSRGGITALEHIAARCPVAIAEEPHHWLGRHQRDALTRAGLCIPISLATLRQNPEELIGKLLDAKEGKPELDRVRRRMHGIWVGADDWFADYLLGQYLT